METMTAAEASRDFDALAAKVQNEPVRITADGKQLFVAISGEDYEAIEEAKMEFLRKRVETAERGIAAGRVFTHEEVFGELLSEDTAVRQIERA